MKVLFVRSNNNGLDAISTRQGQSLQKEGIELIFFNIKGKGAKGYLKNLAPLRKYINQENPNVIHAHYSLSGILTTLAFGGRPIVVSLMGSDVLAANKLALILVKFCSRIFWQHTIAKSEEIYSHLQLKNCSVIPNGVDVDVFKSVSKQSAIKELGWDQSKQHILFASSPKRPEKNFDLASKAFEQIKLTRPDIELHFLQNLSMEEMVQYYNAADVLLLTSFYEGSPNVIKEAMACNCPIVSTNVGDVKHIMFNTEQCYVTGFEPTAVAAALDKVLSAQQRTEGRKRILELKLDSDSVAKKIIEIYNRIAK